MAKSSDSGIKTAGITEYQIEVENNVRFDNTVFQISINKDSWNNLPPDLQKVITGNTDGNY